VLGFQSESGGRDDQAQQPNCVVADLLDQVLDRSIPHQPLGNDPRQPPHAGRQGPEHADHQKRRQCPRHDADGRFQQPGEGGIDARAYVGHEARSFRRPPCAGLRQRSFENRRPLARLRLERPAVGLGILLRDLHQDAPSHGDLARLGVFPGRRDARPADALRGFQHRQQLPLDLPSPQARLQLLGSAKTKQCTAIEPHRRQAIIHLRHCRQWQGQHEQRH